VQQADHQPLMHIVLQGLSKAVLPWAFRLIQNTKAVAWLNGVPAHILIFDVVTESE
jgi:hypothetical protein